MSMFNVIFSGEISEGFELDDVKNNFKNHFHLSDLQTEFIFSGKEVILKKNLTQVQALEFAMSIDDIGGISYFEPIKEAINLPPGVTEDRRKGERRKRADRRKNYRAGINSDRRIHSDRRKS